MRIAFALIIIIATLPLAGAAQSPTPGQLTPAPPATQLPPRDPSGRGNTPPTGTSSIAGVVLDAVSGNPIRRARVSVTGPIGSERMTMNFPAALTDGEGRFELRGLRAGGYTFQIGKNGYLSLTLSNGGKPVPPLEVGEGQALEKVVLRLARGGVISGNLLDDFGDPVLGGEVRAMRYRYNNGQRQLMPVMVPFPNFSTDDLGGFRLFGLEPGDYYIVGRPAREFSGPGTVQTVEGPGQTYYPGTPNVSEARRVTVRAGRETSGIVFQLVPTRLSRIRGRVITSTGEPFIGSVSLTQRDGTMTMTTMGSSVLNGTFDLQNVQPGSYVIVARPRTMGPESDPGAEFGQTQISVNGEDLTDIAIITGRGGTIRGRIITDEGVPPPFVAKSYTLMAQPAEPGAPILGRQQGKVADDWTFEIDGVFERVRLQNAGFTTAPAAPPGPWNIKVITVGGQDVTDSGIEVRPGRTIDNVEIVYTRKLSRLSGLLTNNRGEQAEGWVIVFSADESLWKPQSRFVRAIRPGPGGKYATSVTPYDDYLVVGVAGIEDGQWQDPDFLRLVKELGVRFSIGEGETKTLDVKLVEWRR